MKRTISILLTLAMLLGIMLCASGCKLLTAGTYYFYEMEEGGETYDADDLEEMGMDPDEFCILELEADGTGTMTFMGEEADIEWDSDEIWVEDEKDDAVEYKLSGSKITLEIEGTELTLKKK